MSGNITPAVAAAWQGQQSAKYSCVLCKKRKVRCDRERPCAGCVRAGVDCEPSSRAPYRRRRRDHPDTPASPTSLHNGPEGGSSRPETPTRAVEAGHAHRAPTFGQNLWTGMYEFQSPSQAKSSMAETEESLGDSVGSSPLEPAVFMMGAVPVVDLREAHPSPVHAFILWQAFLHNVNPISKIIHAPSVQDQVVEATRDFDSVSRNVAALLFSIYAAAVMSMTEEECQTKLDDAKKVLHDRYLAATQQALASSGLIRSSSFVLLQAFTIFLLASRKLYDVQSMWILTGMAVRMGLRLELVPSDNSSIPVRSFFDAQLRLRLHWQIAFLDGRATQLCGQTFSFVDREDVPLPANLNDADISPEMLAAPPISDRPTEMICCLMRYEVGMFLMTHGKRLHHPMATIAEKDRLIDELEAHILEHYLKHCDPGIPFHALAAGGARSGICKMRMLAHHPGQYPDKGSSLPQSEHDLLFFAALEMIDMHVTGFSEPSIQKYLWHLDIYFQLDAFVFMVIELRRQPPVAPNTEKAWGLIAEVFKYRPELLKDDGNELHSSVRQLVIRTWAARESEARRQGVGPLTLPPIVEKLRSMAARPPSRPEGAFPGPVPSLDLLRHDQDQMDVESSSSTTAPEIPAVDQFQVSNLALDDYSYPINDGPFLGLDEIRWEDWSYWDELLKGQLLQQ